MGSKKEQLKEAVLWEPAEGGKVRCKLCNWRCLISTGELGRCSVRKNVDGTLCSLNYNKVCSANPDPIAISFSARFAKFFHRGDGL